MNRFEKRAAEIVSKLETEEKLGLLSTHHFKIGRMGMEEFCIGTEVARGYVGREPEKVSTVFPQPIGLASTFDRELLEKLGRIAGLEARAYYNRDRKGGLMLWGPTVDMERDPRWGRTEEAYGEDVFLTGELSAAYTRGMADEGEDGTYMTVPTLKHFCADNNEEGRGHCDAYLPPRLKHEYYYAAFENAVVNGGARSMMAAYNEINGQPAIMNGEMESIVKDEWGLWFTVSDGGDLSQNVTCHKYCDDMSDAFALSLKGGCDIMTDDAEMVREAAKKALEKGIVTEEDIDRSLVRTLAARLRTGQELDGTKLTDRFDHIDMSVVDCESHREINRRAAEEQLVLLKNDGLLPLKGTPDTIAVLGPMADENHRDWYTGYPAYETTVLEAVKKAFPRSRVISHPLWDKVILKTQDGRLLSVNEAGEAFLCMESAPTDNSVFFLQDWGENWKNLYSPSKGRYLRLSEDGTLRLHNRKIYDWFTRETFNFRQVGENKVIIEEYLNHRRLTVTKEGRLIFKAGPVSEENTFTAEIVEKGTKAAEELAKDADLVIYCTGNHPVQTAKECYDRKTLALNIQEGMAVRLGKHSKKLMLMLISSYPYSVCEESRAADAVMWSSHAGAELGNVIAAAVKGDISPTGRLPMTWYRSELDLPDILNYDIETAGSTYMYFGGTPLYPFGYGLTYSGFSYGRLRIEENEDRLTAYTDITNTSDRDGTETVQIYFTVKDSAVKRESKKLCGFERVFVKSGETVSAAVSIPRYILRIYDVRCGKMIVEDGIYTFMAGSSSAHIHSTAEHRVKGAPLSKRESSFSSAAFDRGENIRIYRSKRTGKDAVRPTAYSGTAVYGGIDGSRQVTLKVSSLMGSRRLTVSSGEDIHEAIVPPCDSYDDTRDFTFSFEKPVTELEVTLAEGMSLSRIETR